MKPYYERDGITLFNADMLEVTVPFVTSVFVTDPPYSRAGAVHTGRSTTAGTASDAAGSDQFWLYWFRHVARKIGEYTRPIGCGFVFCDYRTVNLIERAFESAGCGWSVTQCLVWDRDGMGLGSPFRASHELIAFVRGPDFKWTGRKDIRNVIRYPWQYGAHPNHPAEKPVGLIRQLLEWVATSEWDTVFDPFAGSGPTLLAAKDLGLRAVGIEAVEEHCATAVSRLAQEAMAL